MKDIRVTLRAQNNRLISAIEDRFGSQAELARVTGVAPGKISALVAFKDRPVNRRGWTSAAEAIASALGMYPSDLWPDHIQHVRLAQSKASVALDVEEVQSLTVNKPDTPELQDMIFKGAANLSQRETRFLAWLLSGNSDATIEQKGKYLGVSRERARQIEFRMHRKMRQTLEKRHGIKGLSA